MASLLDDVNRIIQLGYGDIERLQKIKETLEKNKMLVVAERKYLLKLCSDHPDTQIVKKSRYEAKNNRDYSEAELDLDELEEKIRVESEPS